MKMSHENSSSDEIVNPQSSMDLAAEGKTAFKPTTSSSSLASNSSVADKDEHTAQSGKTGTLDRVISALHPAIPGSYSTKANRRRVWLRTFIRWEPLSGIVAMIFAIASVFAALGILVGSDGRPVATWSAPPSTYLAIFTALANLSIRYAAINGMDSATGFENYDHLC